MGRVKSMHDLNEDQAKELRERLGQITNEKVTDSINEVDSTPINQHTSISEHAVDVLSLPPRSQLHEEKKQKVRMKISYAMIRLLVIIFIVLVVLILTYPYWRHVFINTQNESTVGAQTVEHTSELRDERFLLSKEIQRSFDDGNGNEKAYKGRYYMTLTGESLSQIVDRFYGSQKKLAIVKELNAIKHEHEPLPVNTRIFLVGVSYNS